MKVSMEHTFDKKKCAHKTIMRETQGRIFSVTKDVFKQYRSDILRNNLNNSQKTKD